MSWYIVSTLFPMRRAYSPRHCLTEILLYIRAMMASFSHRSSGVLNVMMFWPVASVRSCSVLGPFTNRTLSPRSLGLVNLMLFSMIRVSMRAFANPAGSASGAYWISANCGVEAGSGIVMERFSHSSGSSRLYVLSSTLSTGVNCFMILFLDLGWIGGGVLGTSSSV